ncbi:MAG: transketolase, partial [Burkholderiales bacterium]|nr:transketolase [Burkholderiales bacterium]
LPHQPRADGQVDAIRRGGYVLVEAGNGKPEVVLLATGSELALAVEARSALEAEGIATRVVSMPATTVFDRQDAAWRQAVLPPGVPRVAVEAGVTDFWRKYVGLEGDVVGIDRFGESAPAGDLFTFFGITAAKVAAAARGVIRR